MTSSVRTADTEVSIIIPCFNETESIGVLYQSIAKTMATYSFEIIFVDDGSYDNTLERIVSLASTDSRVKYLSFSRNFGHQKAIKAGLSKAKGQAVIMMDADMQHPVSLLPLLIRKWKEGFEVVNTIRTDERGSKYSKRLFSRLFYAFINFLSDTPIQHKSADFRLLDKKVVDGLNQCHEESFFLRGMIPWCGFRTCSVAYQAEKRWAGKSKYTYTKMLSLALCGITAFSIKPLRLAILLATFFVLLSLVEMIYVVYIYTFTDEIVSGWASLAILISLLGASVLFTLGIIGEYIGKLFMQSKQRPEYVVSKSSYDDSH